MARKQKTLQELYPTGRKNCSSCGAYKLLFDFNAHGWVWVGGKDGQHQPKRLQARCKTCNRRTVKARKQGRKLPDLIQEALNRHAPRLTEQETREERAPAPTRRERKTVPAPVKETKVNRGNGTRVPYGPFIEWLETYLASPEAVDNGHDLPSLCAHAGTSARAVYRHQLSGDPDIDLVIVERVGRISGNPDLALHLYPKEAA